MIDITCDGLKNLQGELKEDIYLKKGDEISYVIMGGLVSNNKLVVVRDNKFFIQLPFEHGASKAYHDRCEEDNKSYEKYKKRWAQEDVYNAYSMWGKMKHLWKKRND